MPQISFSVNNRDLLTISRKLGQIQGTPLALRMQAAIKDALKMLVGPIKAAAPVKTGNLRGSVRSKSLRKRPGEIAAYEVGPTARHRHLVIRGHRMVTHQPTHRQVGFVEGNPFVDRAVKPLEGAVQAYVSERVSVLT